jgi:hypothetical protein
MRDVVIGLPAVRASLWVVPPLSLDRFPFGFAIRGPWLAPSLDSLCCFAPAIAVVVEPAGTPTPNVTEDTVEPVVRRRLALPTDLPTILAIVLFATFKTNNAAGLGPSDSGVEVRGKVVAPRRRQRPLIHLNAPECIDLEAVRMVMSCAA